MPPARPRWRPRRAAPARARTPRGVRAQVVALTAGVDEDESSRLADPGVVGEHREAERARMARQRLGERRAARENAHARRGGSRRLAARRPRRRACSGSADWNVEPTCGWLSTVMLPAHEVGELAADRQPEPAAAEAPGGRLVGLREGLEDLADRRPRPCRCRCRSPRCSTPRPSALAGCTSARTTTSPWAVNFTALPIRFIRICRTRSGSPSSAAVLGRRRAHDQLDALRLGGARRTGSCTPRAPGPDRSAAPRARPCPR